VLSAELWQSSSEFNVTCIVEAMREEHVPSGVVYMHLGHSSHSVAGGNPRSGETVGL
jgi:hypothetical protein